MTSNEKANEVVEALEDDFIPLRQKVEEIEAQNSSLRSQISTLEKDMADIKRKVETHEDIIDHIRNIKNSIRDLGYKIGDYR